MFGDDEREYLARVWMRDPIESTLEADSGAQKKWNGEFYCSFGGGRNWEEARKYGFISGGGGRFYSQTLALLNVGDRVWVNIPGTGYVGVGRVEETVVPVEEFLVPNAEGQQVPITQIPDLDIAQSLPSTVDAEKAEYVVRMRWDVTVPTSKAVKERGFFGVQHTVARPKDERWQYTVDRLKSCFSVP